MNAASPSNFGIRSLSFPGLSVVYIQLADNVKDKEKQFTDINLKMNQLNPAARRRTDSVQQQLRRHGCTDADGRQSDGEPTEVALRAIAIPRRSRRHARSWPGMRRSRA